MTAAADDKYLEALWAAVEAGRSSAMPEWQRINKLAAVGREFEIESGQLWADVDVMEFCTSLDEAKRKIAANWHPPARY